VAGVRLALGDLLDVPMCSLFLENFFKIHGFNLDVNFNLSYKEHLMLRQEYERKERRLD
jgi:hypothetical protein